MAIPGGSEVGKSFNECTTKSTQLVERAASSSLVKRDFSPIFGKGMSRTLSPNVLIVTKMFTLNKKMTLVTERTYQLQSLCLDGFF
jgi:hypothetical protein